MRRKIEDMIKDLWIALVEERQDIKANRLGEKELQELISLDLVIITEGKIKLTDKGNNIGRKLVRLHRLTERLLFDILGIEEKVYGKAACCIEHVITSDLEEAICTLLGHPRMCPHGKPIPPGKCCINKKKYVEKIVYSLNELSPGDKGKLSYIHSVNPELLTKLMSLGLIPGKRIRVLKKFPSYVVQVGNTQIALDEELSKIIYIIKS